MEWNVSFSIRKMISTILVLCCEFEMETKNNRYVRTRMNKWDFSDKSICVMFCELEDVWIFIDMKDAPIKIRDNKVSHWNSVCSP